LDNFNHRLISLFYAAWTKYRFPIQSRSNVLSKSDRKQGPAGIRVALAAVAGLDRSLVGNEPEVTQTPKVDRDEWLGLAGILAQRPMNATNLAAAIERCLGVNVKILQFQGCWLELDEDSQCQLGTQNHQLGIDTVLGDRTWTRQQRILIQLGPLTHDEFIRFLPPSETNAADGYLRLRELVEVFCGPALQFDICPILQIQQPMEVQLTALSDGQRLGIDSWLGTPLNSDVATDAVFAGCREHAA
jgi:type VI secretion system protein ImpH